MTLKRVGSTSHYKGLCPFHQEKTPSFSVRRDHQYFKCFGCGEGGDVFTFVMKRDNLTFYESMVSLAEQYGIPVPKRSEIPEPEVALRAAL